MNGVPAALGVSSEAQFEVNSLAVPRKAKESIGELIFYAIFSLSIVCYLFYLPLVLRMGKKKWG